MDLLPKSNVFEVDFVRPGHLGETPSVGEVLGHALGCRLKGIVVLGYRDAAFTEYYNCSIPDGGDVLWLMEKAKHKLLTRT